MYTDSLNHLEPGKSVKGEVIWKSPSNIAIVKYWGKKPVQIPRNPSLSFTLQAAHTITSVVFENRKKDSEWINFLFEGTPNQHFGKRIEGYLSSILEFFPFLKDLSLRIKSHNSFPHSSGIASSASAMSALALCICDMERIIFELPSNKDFYKKASFIARLGSGSACRSVYPKATIWGHTDDPGGPTSDEWAVPFEDLDPVFKDFRDDIIIVSSDEKSVSSSAGHRLMESNWFAESRYAQARSNMKELESALRTVDLEKFGTITENEALTLHALMMCSTPSYMLMRPNTVAIIEKVRAFRRDTGTPVFFTLDAGPNVHLLYPSSSQPEIRQFLNDELLRHTETGHVIHDRVGDGPQKLPEYPG